MLKEAQFFGFKSFADRERVAFSDGITGIIGPNGCGKSNIFDGIRWVLGEQSAKSLRGGKMEDVIFSGSDERKPRDFAEVTLTFDNTAGLIKYDSDTVTVTRKTHRKGGSEYYINGEAARLKDIQTLFMDSGIGSSSYSMIGQGEIGKILSTNIQERRAIFEEASGIVKLRHQKEQTEKHLKEVDLDLVRIEDIIKEIEKQLTPLRNQAKKAKEYNEISGELKTLETQYLVQEYDKIFEKISETNTLISALTTEIEQLTSLLDEKEFRLNEVKNSYQVQNDEIFSFQQEGSSLKEEIEKLNGSITLGEERLQNAIKQIKEIDENLREIEEKYSLSTEDYNFKKNRMDSISHILSDKQKEIETLNEQISQYESDKLILNNDVEFSRKHSADEYNDLTQKRFEKEQLEKRETEIKEDIRLLQETKKTMEEEKSSLEEEFNRSQSDFSSFEKEFNLLRSTIQNLETQSKEFRLEIQHLVTELQEVESEWIRTKSKLESLETFIENNEGFFEGVKSILEAKKAGQFEGVHGVVAELIKVKKKHEVAIEGLLQSSMQVLITKDDQVAKECVEFLKKEKKGRATFKPLNLSHPLSFDSKEKSLIDSFEGIHYALEAITYDKQYEVAMSSFLGKSLIADTLDIALNFLKKCPDIRAKISTVDGEIVQQGMISGGASKKQKANFFSKRREHEELKNDFDQLTVRLEELKQTKSDKTSDVQRIDNELSASYPLFDENKTIFEEKNELLQDCKLRIERFNEKFENLIVEEKELKIRLNEISDRVIDLRFSIDEKESNHKELNEKLEQSNRKLLSLTNDMEEMKDKKTNTLMDINRLQEEHKQLSNYLEDFNSDNDSVEIKIQRLYQRKEEENTRIAETNELNANFEQQLSILQVKYKEHHEKVDSMRSDIQEYLVSMQELEQEVKNTRLNKENKEKELNQKEVYLSRKETEKSNILSRLDETYEIKEEDIPELDRSEIDVSSSKKEIDKLKKQISALGSINHTAIEECEKLEERYTTEKTQLDDIKNAKNDLLSLLKNVEDEMITRFTSTFNDIAEKFEKIFVDLFGGGRAKLSLVDSKEPLTSAVEIIAQPPGKKPQSINLLSGGEKAFTAVALIFAIISAKPSPFVYLDEVDAPLDDANVARFAHYLKKFSDKTQFIVVTHRKGTKMQCDQIYGVTQQVRGVTIVFPHSIEEEDVKKSI